MNVLFFLIPKNQVAYLEENFTVRQAIEKMEHHHYSAIPIISKDGKYIGTLSEGDLLWFFKARNLRTEETNSISINEVPRRKDIKPISINQDVSSLVTLIVNQNFVPVEDDRGLFIGIVTRRAIIEFLIKNK